MKKKAILDETRKMSFQLVNAMLAPLYYLQKEFKETEKNAPHNNLISDSSLQNHETINSAP